MTATTDRSLLIAAFASTINALDRKTGAIRWMAHPFGTPSGLGDHNEVEIAISDNVVICANAAYLAFLDYPTGALHTVVQLPHANTCRPTMLIDGPHVYITGENVVSCFTIRGHLVWNQPFDGSIKTASIALGLPGNIRQGDDKGSR
jgi:hypothetical protein